MIQQFKLIEKVNLTNDVYELTFEWENELKILPWQFITFLIDKIWGRAYSILKLDWKKIILIIKKWELDDWWRWWSKLICDLNVWETLKWVWPAWNFLLKENNNNKLFICTWTWFVPLYNQIVWALKANQKWTLKLLFWVRTKKGLFYTKELEEIKKKHSNFEYEIYLSREDIEGYNKWYTTDYLTKENCTNFSEFYICWAPGMIEWAVEILKNNQVNEKNIYFEKY